MIRPRGLGHARVFLIISFAYTFLASWYRADMTTKMSTITDGVAIVTGACGAIGTEVAQSLARAGLSVVIASRPQTLKVCKEKFLLFESHQQFRGQYHFEQIDFAQAKSVHRFIKVVRQKYGSQLRVLVNAAAAYPRNERQLTDDGFEVQLQVNVWGYYVLMKSFLPLLSKNLPSSILNVASTSALIAASHDSFKLNDLQFEDRAYDVEEQYEQTKAAVVSLSLEMARQSDGVLVNAMHPGLVWLPNDYGHRSGLLTEEEMEHGCGLWCTSAADAGALIAQVALGARQSGKFLSVSSYANKSTVTDVTSFLHKVRVDNHTWQLGSSALGKLLWTQLERVDMVLQPNWASFNSHVISAPHKFMEYDMRLSKCSWSEPVSLAEQSLHRSSRVRDVEPYCFHWNHKRRPVDFGEPIHDIDTSCLVNSTLAPVRVCNLHEGETHFTVTRVGPVRLPPGRDLWLLFVPEAPSHGRYLVEAIDISRDANMNVLPYPPLHSHHSQAVLTGMDLTRDTPGFEDFTPLTNIGIEKGTMQNPSSVQPGADQNNVCFDESDGEACYYLRYPSGMGIWKKSSSDFWAETRLINEHAALELHVVIEYGRKWVTPSARKKWTELTTLDFSITEAHTYNVKPNRAPSIAWRSYVLPAPAIFVSVVLHSHGELPSTTWLVRGSNVSIIPEIVRARAQTYSVPRSDPVLKESVPIDEAEVLTIQGQSQKRALCIFESNRVWMNNRWNGRAAEHVAAQAELGCKNVRFQRGDVLTLVAINEPVAELFLQHTIVDVLAVFTND